MTFGKPDYLDYSAGGGSGKGGRRGGGGGGGNGGNEGRGKGDGSGMSGPTQWLGIFIAAAGIFGYLKTRSKASIVSGMAFGFTLLFASILMADPTNKLGLLVALATTATLAYFFGRRFLENRKIFPSGVMGGLSTIYSLAYISSLL